MDADGIEVEEGDMLCLHTGFADLVLDMGGQPDGDRLHTACAALNGRDPALLRWIDESGIACLIADNYAVEAYPAVAGRAAMPPCRCTSCACSSSASISASSGI
jgi:hypothetical protein